MAQKGADLDQGFISCPICLDLVKDPVTTPCGHSYCRKCIEGYWDSDPSPPSCPQCKETFIQRPVLGKNIMLAALVEELKQNQLPAAPADCGYAGPEDVACDVCAGRKVKAAKSCLMCRASYCQEHLLPHKKADAFRRHKLTEPSRNLLENICPRHDEVMKMFCRTDERVICHLCSVDEHKGHDMTSVAAERAERQKEVEEGQVKIQQRIQDKEEEVKLLQQQLETIIHSAEQTLEENENVFDELSRLLQDGRRDVEQQVRSQQQSKVNGVLELQEELEQEIRELKRRASELEQLSHIQDHCQFLHSCPSLLPATLEEDACLSSSSSGVGPVTYFEKVTTAVSLLKDRLEETLTWMWTALSPVDTGISEPKSRADFLRYSREITLDPNTAFRYVTLSEGNRKATWTSVHQLYPDHPDRFTDYYQVLSREGLTGRCYWEVEWAGGEVYVAVAYKNISRAGEESLFRSNNSSWTLDCLPTYRFFHNKNETNMFRPPPSRVGVYLDHGAGVLSFYLVSENMKLLHTVQTSFT